MGGCCEREADVPSAALQGTQQRVQEKVKDFSTVTMLSGSQPSNQEWQWKKSHRKEALGSTPTRQSLPSLSQDTLIEMREIQVTKPGPEGKHRCVCSVSNAATVPQAGDDGRSQRRQPNDGCGFLPVKLCTKQAEPGLT